MIQHMSEKFKVFHDSDFPFLLGGSKARKLRAILDHAKTIESNSIVSAGSASSNHARDCALACAQLGWKCTLIIHDKEDYNHPNLFLMKLVGAELFFCDLANVSQNMDNAMESHRQQGFNPYYIWGGGHSVYGVKALVEAVTEFKKCADDWKPDYVIVPSGTGGIQAGLHVGFGELYPDAQVIGVSVARDQQRGTKVVNQAIDELKEFYNIQSKFKKVVFLDRWVGEGYGRTYPNLLDTIKKYSRRGLLTDITYTGKALCALDDLWSLQEISPDSKVLFWHTGGMLNLLNDKARIMKIL